MSALDREYRLGPSRAYVLMSLVLHGGAAVALWASRLESGILMVLTSLLMVALVRDVRINGLRRGPGAVSRIRIHQHTWTLCRNEGADLGPARLRSAWVLGQAVLLRLARRPWQGAVVVVPADALPPQAFRHLRIAAGAALDAGGAS